MDICKTARKLKTSYLLLFFFKPRPGPGRPKMLCRALLALASIRHKWKAPGASRACGLRSLPALATKWKAPYNGQVDAPSKECFTKNVRDLAVVLC